MKFLVSLLKLAPKGDNFRPLEKPVKYANQIAILNSTGDNQYAKLRASVTNTGTGVK